MWEDVISKIFGIGISKTGLTSTRQALTRLGFKGYQHPSPALIKALKNEYDFGIDNPFMFRFDEFDRQFPGSKFIVTYRNDEEAWLKSVYNTHEKLKYRQPPLPQYGLDYRMDMHGRLDYEVENKLAVKKHHYERISEHFKGREQDVLYLNVTDGNDGYKELCEFLNVPFIDEPYPHENKSVKLKGIR